MNEYVYRLKAVKQSRNAHNKFGNYINFKLQDKPKNFDPLTTKNAVKFLLEGTLKYRVCKYCLCVVSQLSELDEIYEVALKGAIYKVTIRDMIACVHPFKAVEDPNLPDKICERCIESAIRSYLFSQQCERSERALRNCFDDIYEKFEKLDPLERSTKRGRYKLNPNHNILYTENEKVIDYADSIIKIVNVGAVSQHGNEISELECPKCWQELPDIEALLNHQNMHPKSMWYTCRLCGQSFVKHRQYKKHIKEDHAYDFPVPVAKDSIFKCNRCGCASKTFGQHLLHMEKHKFKRTFKHLINRNLDKLCAVCLEKDTCMLHMNETIHMYGGYPGLNNEMTIHNIVSATFPEITLHKYTGTHICDKCLEHAITTYVFVTKIRFVRNRLFTCVSGMLGQLNEVSDLNKNIMIEIAQDTILPQIKEENDVFEDSGDDIDESKLQVDVLEDEFRIKSSSEDESDAKSERSEIKSDIFSLDEPMDDINNDKSEELINNLARNVTKTYVNKKLLNGSITPFDDDTLNDVCEFLTFKNKRKTVRRSYKCRFTCPYCNKHFISDYFLRKHILKHTVCKVECKKCDMKFKSKFHLYEHVKMIHLMKETFYSTCKDCGRMFNNTKKMKKHEKIHKMKECQLCDKFFRSQKHYDQHIQRHSVKFNMMKNWRVQTCSFCEKECANENELSLHVNKAHLQIKPYGCDMCDRLFYTEYDLKNHKKVHSLYSEESCEFCEKTFKCRKHLVIHVRKHLGTKPHVCQVCRQAFYSEYRLKRHMVIYHGGRFCCRLCKMVMATKSELNTHISIEHNAM